MFLALLPSIKPKPNQIIANENIIHGGKKTVKKGSKK